jgi:hypothetical protein
MIDYLKDTEIYNIIFSFSISCSRRPIAIHAALALFPFHSSLGPSDTGTQRVKSLYYTYLAAALQ